MAKKTYSKAVIQRAKHVHFVGQQEVNRNLSISRRVKSQSTGKFIRFLLAVLGLIAFILFVFVVIKKTYGGSSLSFTSFLTWLSERDTFSISVNISSYGVSGNWGIFDGFRIFLDHFAKLAGVLAWLGSNLLNIVLFLGQFVLFIFS